MARPSNSRIFERNRQEHDELRDLLGSVQHVLTKRQGSITDVRDMLRSLQRKLRAHFEEEEQGGFFNQIVEVAPRLSERSNAIRDEHTRLSASMCQLVDLSDEPDGEDWWQALTTKFHEFSKELMHHETEENDLLQEAYTEDIGPAD